MIQGIEKISLNDFPGKVSCVLFISGCNFFCPYCHNPQMILNHGKYEYDINKIISFLLNHKKYVDGIVISGGEATLNPNLKELCHKIKGIGLKLKLDTNGSRPDIINDLLKNKLLDYIAMDIKTLLTKKAYSLLTNEDNIINSIKKSIKIIMEKAPDYEFRTTCVNPFIDSQTIKHISSIIKGAKRYILQPFNENAQEILNKKFFKKQKPKISDKEIFNLIRIAKNRVKKCNINYIQ